MARPPRGGSRSADVRGTLGSLIKSTLAQAGVVRDVLERGAREGRSRLDEARAGRRRQEALAELGEAVLELIRRGEIDPAELPEVRDIVADLDELDRGGGGGARGGAAAWGREALGAFARRAGVIREDHEGHHGHDGHDDEPDEWHAGLTDEDRDRHTGGLAEVALPRARERFDSRGPAVARGGDGTVSSHGGRGDSDGTVSSRAGRGDSEGTVSSRGGRGDSDGTVSSRGGHDGTVSSRGGHDGTVSSRGGRDGTVSSPGSARWSATPGAPAPARKDARVWRPPAAAAAAAAPRPPIPEAAVSAHKGGGIRFDDDDLADYMHPDDVPPKPPHDEP